MQAGKKTFRDYSEKNTGVTDTYRRMHTHQNTLFVRRMKNTLLSPDGHRKNHGQPIRMTLFEAASKLDAMIDESDPDTGLPQIIHACQTGEALKSVLLPDDPTRLRPIPIRTLFQDREWAMLPPDRQHLYAGTVDTLYPHLTDWSWLPLIGFLHDLGKVLALEEWGSHPQWAVVGDTFPVGAPFSASNVCYEYGFFRQNPDLTCQDIDPDHFGQYRKHCGFDQVDMSFGHDEYGYGVLNRTLHHLPPEALYIIRFHSFYPWHTPANGIRGYTELASEQDWRLLPLLKLFQRCDLYSKKEELIDTKALCAEYAALIERYIPNRIKSPYALRPAKIRW